MTLWTGLELNQIFGTSLLDDLQITGISIDTRTLQPGDLFVALKGESGDGHDFLECAIKAGAAAALVHKDCSHLPLPHIKVDDTLEGLRILAQQARKRSHAKIIAITGSVGKTSTKDMLAHVLSHFGRVSYSHASYNNHWGVPLSLARMEPDAQFAVFEIGMNNPGEILPLAQLVQPEIAVITAIAPAHIGHMGSLQTIATEKAQIFHGLTQGGIAILAHDSPYKEILIDQVKQSKAQTILSFGFEEGADFYGEEYQVDSGQHTSFMTVHAQGEKILCQLNLVGEHLARIALAITAVARGLGLDLSKTMEALCTVRPVKGRGQHHRLSVNGMPIYLIDDAYNANLTSMMAGMKVLTSLQPDEKGRKIAVLGEMLELGDYALDHHQQVIEFIAHSSIDLVFATGGKVVERCFELLPSHQQGEYTEHAVDLIPCVLQILQPDDIVYVKGSKGSRVSCVVDALLSQSNSTIIENAA